MFLLDAPIPPTTVAEVVIKSPRLLSNLGLDDTRSSVWDAARLAGWNLEWSDAEFTGATISDGSSSAMFQFDEQARVTKVEGSLRS